MIRRIETLAPPRTLAPRTLAPQPLAVASSDDAVTGSVLRLADGQIAANLRQTAPPDGHGHAKYELAVVNDTPAPLATCTGTLDESTSRGRTTWETIAVPPHSAIAVEIEVCLPRATRHPRVVAELFAHDAQLTVHAAPTRPPSGPRRFGRVAAAASGAVLVTLAAVGALAYERSSPRVLVVAAPAIVRDRAAFTVAYALNDARDARYFVETPSGDEIQSGKLTERTGSFSLTLPSAATSRDYNIRVWTAGRFGSDQRSAHVVAQPKDKPRVVRRPPPRRAAPPKPAHVALLQLERDVVRGGDDIAVTYRTSSQSPTGDVRLIDQTGTVRAQALLNARGRSLLVAPHVDVDQDFRITLVTQRGNTRDEARTALTILKDDALQAQGRSAVLGPIAFNPDQIHGRPIVVSVLRYEPGLHVALMGATAQEVAGASVAPDATTVVLTLPKGETRPRYDLVATYTSGMGQETLVRPVMVHSGR